MIMFLFSGNLMMVELHKDLNPQEDLASRLVCPFFETFCYSCLSFGDYNLMGPCIEKNLTKFKKIKF